MREPRIRRRRDGTFDLDIPADQRDLLRGVPGQMRDLLASASSADDEAVRRLFPTADLDDPDHAAEFDRMVRDDLLEQRAAAIETMERTIDSKRVGEDDLVAWLGVVNDSRLVLGTRLGVTEETTPEDFRPGDPGAHAYTLYWYLSFLQERMVEALSAGL